jgi:eukaryotic-like serine/threonine-protein kinase
MVTDLTAEQLAQRALDVNIVSEEEMRGVWGEVGAHNVEYEQFKQILMRRGLLTNFQLERLEQGYRRHVCSCLSCSSPRDQRIIRSQGAP